MDQKRLARVRIWVEAAPLAIAVCGAWIPLGARLTPANTLADNAVAPHLIEELPGEARFVLGDIHYNAPNVREACESTERFLVTPPNEELTRTPMMASKSDASCTSCAAWPTRTSTCIERGRHELLDQILASVECFPDGEAGKRRLPEADSHVDFRERLPSVGDDPGERAGTRRPTTRR